MPSPVRTPPAPERPPAERPPAERPADETRDRIIEAAQAIFARDGFAGAKMQEIADRVGIQRPSLFYHFKNKEALFVAAHERVFARIEPHFRESLAPGGDPFAQLDRVSRAVLAVMAEEPHFARMVARTAVDRHPSAVAIVRSYLQPLVELSVEFVRTRQARGIFRDDIDPFFFTLNSWGAALLYFTACDLLAPGTGRREPQGLDRFTRTLVQMGNRALAPHPAQAAPHSEYAGPHPGSAGLHPSHATPHPGHNAPHPGHAARHPGHTAPHPGHTAPDPEDAASGPVPRRTRGVP